MLGGVKSRLAAAETVSNPTEHREIEDVHAQRKAESAFAAQLVALGCVRPDQIRRRLRLDDTFQQGKREVNLILVTDYVIYCFVIRNWAGKFSPGSDGKFWIQRTEFDEQIKVTQFPSPLVDLEQQTKLLHGHLVKTGAAVKQTSIKGHLVFTNAALELPEEVEKNQAVLVKEKIPQFCRSLQKTWRQYLTDPLIPSLLTGALSYNQLSASTMGLKKAGTWDKLVLTGGRVVDGDFKGCSMLAFDRANVSKLTFIHSRGNWLGTARALIGGTPKITVQLHKRGGVSGWFVSNLHSTVEVPYTVSVAFHIAGEDTDAQIPANEIESISLA